MKKPAPVSIPEQRHLGHPSVDFAASPSAELVIAHSPEIRVQRVTITAERIQKPSAPGHYVSRDGCRKRPGLPSCRVSASPPVRSDSSASGNACLKPKERRSRLDILGSSACARSVVVSESIGTPQEIQ